VPELPEVEVTRRSIAPGLHHAQVHDLRLGKPLRWPLGVDAKELRGLWLGSAQRRGKYLWLPLLPLLPLLPTAPGWREVHVPVDRPSVASEDNGPGLLLHLGMSGSLAWWPNGSPPPPAGPHDHFELHTSRGLLRLTDPRRFGAVVYSASRHEPPASKLLGGLGPEPFDPALTPERFHACLRSRRAPIKTVLLAGEAVVGAGNIYACEALFLAGIDPRQRAHRLSFARAARLLDAVRSILQQAVDLGGSTLRDFRDAHGMDGAYQAQAAVYGREAQPCPRCSAPVRRIVQAQRATYFCAGCQKR
jgi:formamidopyrimidine-DNA glycosylase